MKFPQVRLRRLRDNPRLRQMLGEHTLLKKELVQPLFIKEGLSRPVEIASMPGQFQWSVAGFLEEAKKLEALGVPAVLLFGVPAKKDLKGLQAFAKKGVIQKAVQAVKKKCPRLVIITDVCLCEYLSHGHCGLIKKYKVQNDSTLDVLAKIALSHAMAGADCVAPSDMMDGRVRAIRQILDRHGFEHLPVISYAVKYASGFYAPFREAAENTPGFGDRASYQMDPANVREALREAATDLEEGADILLVKPALAYGDVIYQIREKFACVVGSYSVSGEYAMIKAASQKGWIDERRVVLETHLALKRAGSSLIVTYWAKDIARWEKM